MNYYKKTCKGVAEYYASNGQPSDIVSPIVHITFFCPDRYWLENRITFPYPDFERIDKKEFEYEYKRAIETFNSVLKPES